MRAPTQSADRILTAIKIVSLTKFRETDHRPTYFEVTLRLGKLPTRLGTHCAGITPFHSHRGRSTADGGSHRLVTVVVTPVADHLPALSMSSVATTLTSSSNPITVWVDVLNTTFNNIALLGQQVQADPSPILDQFVKNQLANVQTIETALSQAGGGLVAGRHRDSTGFATSRPAAGRRPDQCRHQHSVSGRLSLVLAPVISLLRSSTFPGKSHRTSPTCSMHAPNILLPVGLAAISPIAGVVGALGDTGQAVYDALKAGDIPAAVTAIVNTPAVITNAFSTATSRSSPPGS